MMRMMSKSKITSNYLVSYSSVFINYLIYLLLFSHFNIESKKFLQSRNNISPIFTKYGRKA